ncbi:ABC transporter permease [Kiloniella laminariae]|uniref:ABC transporter permease n=1 Tax=Kiloniella laminariae TaxID=454162 RepID=A0ABT4LJ62_9PROT|nr:ABC transporter permease [Kiloniella laminariae]MCZ4281154.1 ABC transporter permease [Kiloniella laminariae]
MTSNPNKSLEHFVSSADFDPQTVSKLTPQQERYYTASQWQIMWWKFRKHKLALYSGIILVCMYIVALLAELVAPYSLHNREIDHIYAPPQVVHLFHEGDFIGPFVYGFDYQLNMENLKREYTPNPAKIQKLQFFCQSEQDYEFWGLIEGNFHFICPDEGGTLFLWGTDRLGRDVFSRIIYGSRISLTIGLIGVTISFVLGTFFGGLAGYFGGIVDNLVLRAVEILKSFPSLPLFMTLSALLPVTWSPLGVFFGISIIQGFLDWPGLARAVRSKLLSLREEDFTTAAQLMGASHARVIGRHLLPSFSSHLIASATLAVPMMILGETSLSFLGLGLRAPITSWGVLLNEAQNINSVVLYPWLLLPVQPVILVVLCYNFLGDGLRDAADPYK